MLVSVHVPIVGNVGTARGVHTMSTSVPVVTIATGTFCVRRGRTLTTKYGRIISGPFSVRRLGDAVRGCL